MKLQIIAFAALAAVAGASCASDENIEGEPPVQTLSPEAEKTASSLLDGVDPKTVENVKESLESGDADDLEKSVNELSEAVDTLEENQDNIKKAGDTAGDIADATTTGDGACSGKEGFEKSSCEAKEAADKLDN